jgi:hypothetical protein
MIITAMPAVRNEVAELDQDLLAIAISAAIIRTQLEQPICADERAELARELERIELVRRTLEQHVTALERPRQAWWRRLLWM